MDLTFTDEQEMLRQAVRELCEAHATSEIVRSLEDDPTGYRPETWKELAKMDLLGLTIPEEHGGMGAGPLELAVVCEELGRALLPSPYFVTCVLGAGLLRAAGSAEQQAAWLPLIAAGDAVLSVAWKEPGRGDGPESVAARAVADGGAWRVSGEKIVVPFASSAARLLVLARAPGGVTLFLVDPADATLEQEKVMGGDAAYRVVLDGAPAEIVGEEGAGWAAFEEAMVDGMIALAAQAVGGAEAAHAMAVAYAKEREQFGRKIGSFQGLAHPLADTATDIAGGKTLVHQAAWARETGRRPAMPLAAMAKLWACDVFKRTTKVGQQVFGGIGFTRDIDMQLYFRRAKQMELLWFGPRSLEELVARAELDAPEPLVAFDPGA